MVMRNINLLGWYAGMVSISTLIFIPERVNLWIHDYADIRSNKLHLEFEFNYSGSVFINISTN